MGFSPRPRSRCCSRYPSAARWLTRSHRRRRVELWRAPRRTPPPRHPPPRCSRISRRRRMRQQGLRKTLMPRLRRSRSRQRQNPLPQRLRPNRRNQPNQPTNGNAESCRRRASVRISRCRGLSRTSQTNGNAESCRCRAGARTSRRRRLGRTATINRTGQAGGNAEACRWGRRACSRGCAGTDRQCRAGIGNARGISTRTGCERGAR